MVNDSHKGRNLMIWPDFTSIFAQLLIRGICPASALAGHHQATRLGRSLWWCGFFAWIRIHWDFKGNWLRGVGDGYIGVTQSDFSRPELSKKQKLLWFQIDAGCRWWLNHRGFSWLDILKFIGTYPKGHAHTHTDMYMHIYIYIHTYV